MSWIEAIPGLNAGTYQRHSLHGGPSLEETDSSSELAGRQPVWVEKNCYVDLWILFYNILNLFIGQN